MPRRSDKELEERLTVVGDSLLQTPLSADELLPLLDQIEELLSKVEQSPPKTMQTSLSTLMKALMVEELMRHSDVDVKVGVASCISEITRITAPDAPYDDDKMKDVFQLIVSSFENLSDVSSRSHEKRATILETMAKIRSCVIMLDLECDQMIIDMFQHFLKEIRVYHSEVIFTSMETIMILVIEESEDISPDLLNPILATLKKNNEVALPIARKLAEKVVQNCREKLQPYLTQILKSLDASFDDYSEVVSSMGRDKTGTDDHDNESTLKDQLVAEGGTEKTNSNDRGDTTVGSPKLTASNGITETEEIVTHANSSEMAQPNAKSMSNTVSDDCGAETSVGVEAKPEHTEAQQVLHRDEILGGDVHVPATGTETDEAAISLDEVKETSINLSPSKSPENEALDLASPTQSSSRHDESQSITDSKEKRKEMLDSKESESLDIASEKVSEGERIPEAKKQRRSGKKQANEPAKAKPSTDKVASKKDEDSTNDSEATQTEKLRHGNDKIDDAPPSGKIDGKKSGRVKPTAKGKALTGKGAFKNDDDSINDSEAMPLDQTEKLGDASDKIEDVSSSGKMDGKKSGHAKTTTKGKVLADKVATKNDEGSTNDSEARPLNQNEKLGDASDKTEDASSSGKIDVKKGGRVKLTKGKVLIDKSASKNDEGSTDDPDAKPLKQTEKLGDASHKIEDASSSGKKEGKKGGHGKPTTKGKVLTGKSTPKNDEGCASDSEARPPNQIEKLGDVSDKIANASSSGKADGKKRGRGRPTSEKKVQKSPARENNDKFLIVQDREMSPDLPLKAMKDEGIQEETTGKSNKRKQAPGTKKSSGTIEYDENLIGSKVKVWWPEDEMFYEGVVASFDAAKKKHKVMYIDGDEEILFLKEERWELVKDDEVSHEDQDDKLSSLEASLDVHRKKKRNTNPGSSAKRRKLEGSPKSKIKDAATKSRSKLKGDAKAEPESKDDTPKPGRKSAGDTVKSKDHSPKPGAKFQSPSSKANAKSKEDTAGTPVNLKQDSQKNAKSKGKTPRSGKTSNTKTTKSGSAKGKGTDLMKERTAESGKSSETAKEQPTLVESETKSGKKRRR